MSAIETYSGYDEDRTAPAKNFTPIVTSDSVDLTYLTRAIYVGAAGNVVVVGTNGIAVTFKGLAAGAILPVRAGRVNATGTTATDLVALW